MLHRPQPIQSSRLIFGNTIVSLSSSEASEKSFIFSPTRTDSWLIPWLAIYAWRPEIKSSIIRYPNCITEVHTCTLQHPSWMNSRASRQVSIPPIPLKSMFLIIGFCVISRMWRKAIGLTARPEYPDTVFLDETSEPGDMVILLMVFIAEMASAPAKYAPVAGTLIFVMFGVIFGITGIETFLLTYAV